MYFRPSRKKDKKIIKKLLKKNNIKYKSNKGIEFLFNKDLKRDLSLFFKDILPKKRTSYALVLSALLICVLSFYVLGLKMDLKSLACENKQLIEKNSQLNCNIDDVNNVILELDQEAKNQMDIIQKQQNQLNEVESLLENIDDKNAAFQNELLEKLLQNDYVNSVIQSRSGNFYQVANQIQNTKIILQTSLDESDILDEVIKKLDQENEQMLDYARRYPDFKPVTGVLTSKYGNRYHPISGSYKKHHGIDIGAGHGTNIYSCAYGRVVEASYNSSSGNYITIDHGNGLRTNYKHLSKILVAVGQTVNKGELIGLVGSTGASTGPHLHLEVHVYDYKTGRWNTTDPLKYVYYS